MTYREISFEQQGTIAILTLNRPDVRNTITEPAMIAEILDALPAGASGRGPQRHDPHRRGQRLFGRRQRQGHV